MPIYGGEFVPPPQYVDNYVLAANVAETATVPAGAEYVVISATTPVWVRRDNTAAIPGGDVTDGTGSAYKPATYAVDGVTSLSLIAPAASKVSLWWIDVDNMLFTV